jgi:hypothetical protein
MSSELDPGAVGSAPISRFAGTLIDVLDRVEYSRVAMDVPDNPVYRLRYEAYRREEFVPFNDAGVVIDDLDGSPNAMCFGVHIDGELVSSIRIHHLSQACRISPSMRTFPEVLGPLLDQGRSYIDPSRFTADYEASLAYPALPFLTLRIAVMGIEYFNASGCLALVRPAHSAFYKRVFAAVEMGDLREYPGLAFPVKLYGSDAVESRDHVFGRFPFFRSTKAERDALFSSTDIRGHDRPVASTSRLAYQRAMANGGPSAILAD